MSLKIGNAVLLRRLGVARWMDHDRIAVNGKRRASQQERVMIFVDIEFW